MHGCQCTTLPPQLLFLASKTARRSAISAARCATARRLSSGVTLVSPRGCRTKGLPMPKGGRGYELVPPGAVLRQVCPLGEHRRKAEVTQVALKRPAVGHRLAAGDAGLSDPGEHEVLGEAVLGHARHVPCPEQRVTREVVLEQEGPGALLMRWTNAWHMVTRHISRTQLLCQLLSRRTDSAVRHNDSQPHSRTARTPPAYTFPSSRSGMSAEP